MLLDMVYFTYFTVHLQVFCVVILYSQTKLSSSLRRLSVASNIKKLKQMNSCTNTKYLQFTSHTVERMQRTWTIGGTDITQKEARSYMKLKKLLKSRGIEAARVDQCSGLHALRHLGLEEGVLALEADLDRIVEERKEAVPPPVPAPPPPLLVAPPSAALPKPVSPPQKQSSETPRASADLGPSPLLGEGEEIRIHFVSDLHLDTAIGAYGFQQGLQVLPLSHYRLTSHTHIQV